jgi:DNA-binding NtrC family response regulator
MAKDVVLRALLVDDDMTFVAAAATLIEREGIEVHTARSLAEARERLAILKPHLLLADLLLPDGNGLDFIKELRPSPATRIVLITGHASVDSAIEAVRARVMDYLVKPLDVEHLRRLLRRAKLEANHTDIAPLLDLSHASFGPLIGASEPIKQVYQLIEKVAPTDATVLIQGESGTGKELVGRAIHEMSRRADKPFLALNCGVLSASLIGSELFGHERGSFTGAVRQQRGYFERAAGGTLFLDEVTEMPAELQAHLLRVLETKTMVRLGGDREIKVDVRVIAATNRRPEDLIVAGRFRKDLFFRLSGFPIHVPPLREREGDVILLARYFLGALNRAHKSQKRFTAQALQRLNDNRWVGNVRELKNVIDSAYLIAGNEIDEKDIQEWSAAWDGKDPYAPNLKIGDTLEDVERELLYAALRYYNGNKRRAAQSLGISLKTVYNRLARY